MRGASSNGCPYREPSAEGPLRDRNVNHGDKISAILIEGHRSSTLSIYNINLLMRREAVECVSNVDNIPK